MKILEFKRLLDQYNDYDELRVIDSYDIPATIIKLENLYPSDSPSNPSIINICVSANFHKGNDTRSRELSMKDSWAAEDYEDDEEDK